LVHAHVAQRPLLVSCLLVCFFALAQSDSHAFLMVLMLGSVSAAVVDAVDVRFPCNRLLEATKLFIPKSYSPPSTYSGDADLKYLTDRFKGAPQFVASAVLTEWPVVRQRLSHEYLEYTVFEAWEMMLRNKYITDSFPNICFLARAALVIMLASVDCERGFSQLVIIKTALRNRLTTHSLDALMRITLTGPNIMNHEEVNKLMRKAYRFWLNRANRYIKNATIAKKR
jgi:hypothetical protein